MVEANSVTLFLKTIPDEVVGAADDNDLSFAERALMRDAHLKRSRLSGTKYKSTEHVSPTSNSCERLFSAARLIMSHLRSSMDCDSCEILLFLKVNRHFWADPKIFDEIMTDVAQARKDDDVIDLQVEDEDEEDEGYYSDEN